MSIRPVDFQTSLPRATEVARHQSAEQAQAQTVAQVAGRELARRERERTEQVHSKNPSVSADGGGAHRGDRHSPVRRPNRRTPAAPEEAAEEPGKGRRLDIKA